MALLLVAMRCGGEDIPEPGDLAIEPIEPVATDEEAEVLDEELPPGEDEASRRGEDDEPLPGEDEEPPPGEDEEPPPRRRSLIAWLLDLGPSAPSGPSEFRAYERLMTLDCAGLIERLDDAEHDDALNLRPRSEALYRAVGSACLAAFDGRSDLWPAARELAAVAGEGTGSCLDRATRRLLDDLLAAHEADPTAIFEAAKGAGNAHAPPCPRIDRLVPDGGPLGAEIRIEGANLAEDVEVDVVYGPPERWSSRPLTVLDRSATELRVLLADDADDHRSVCIALFTEDPDWYADGRMFVVEYPAQADAGETAVEGQNDEHAEEQDDEQADATVPDRPATTVACPPQL
jgi:hypothetical protein